MQMELDEALESHLLALRKLYGLLQSIIGYGIPNISIENACKLLDKRSLQLFKNLLDDARQRLFKSTYSEMFKSDHDQSDVFNTQARELNPPHEDSNSHKNSFPRDDQQRSIKPREVVSEFPNLSFSSNKAAIRNNRIRQIIHDQQITDKTKVPISKEKAADQLAKGAEITRRKRIGCEISNPSTTNVAMSSVDCFSSFVSISTEKKSDIREINDFSKEVAKAIKQIDSHILALQLLNSSTPPVENNDAANLFEKLMESKMNREGVNGKSTWGGNESLSRLASQVSGSGQNLQAKTTSGFSSRNLKAMVDRIESLSGPASGTNQRTSYVHGLRVPLSQDDPTVKKGTTGDRSVPLVPSDNHDQKLNRRLNHETNTRKEKKPRRQIIMRPTLLDHTDNQRRNKPQRKTIRSPSETSSSPYPSSSTGIESESGSYSASSSIDDESEQPSSSSYGRPELSRTRTNIPRRRRDSATGIGRLRRIKNKLGLIFHHQHHHHHHHHHHSNWKLLQKIFNSKKKHENYNHRGKEATVNNLMRKTMVKSNQRGGQNNVGQFHALVEGLMRHVGGRHHSKKPEMRKGGRNKKLVKRIHWWQKLQRRRGVKLPNRRGRVKVGFTSKTPKLKMG